MRGGDSPYGEKRYRFGAPVHAGRPRERLDVYAPGSLSHTGDVFDEETFYHLIAGLLPQQSPPIAVDTSDGQWVMNDSIPRKIKTGGDPRTLPDYVALRDELNKLTHPARPDVDWHYVENRCLSLFEQNGVELQTAAWYTLARTQLAGGSRFERRPDNVGSPDWPSMGASSGLSLHMPEWKFSAV